MNKAHPRSDLRSLTPSRGRSLRRGKAGSAAALDCVRMKVTS